MKVKETEYLGVGMFPDGSLAGARSASPPIFLCSTWGN
jgi:hypothetical protein